MSADDVAANDDVFHIFQRCIRQRGHSADGEGRRACGGTSVVHLHNIKFISAAVLVTNYREGQESVSQGLADIFTSAKCLIGSITEAQLQEGQPRQMFRAPQRYLGKRTSDGLSYLHFLQSQREVFLNLP